MDIDLTRIFDHFYHTRFFVLICTGIFSVLFSLRLDETIKISYWIIFSPLWIWKCTAFIGMVIGTIVWFRLTRQSTRRNHPEHLMILSDREIFIQFKSMLLTFLTNLILLMFELIVCDKLNYKRELISWSICFVPLYILSLLSIATTIWSIRYDRSYEIELFCSLNILQFIFIALRLDETIHWSWILVMIPMWICMSIGFIVLLYIFILTLFASRINRSNPELSNQDRIQQSNFAQSHKWLSLLLKSFLYFSLLTFLILLITKLDEQDQFYNYEQFFLNAKRNTRLSFFACTIPLLIAHACLGLLSFSNRTGNVWWFGIQRDTCEYFIECFPVLKLYGNVKYTSHKETVTESSTVNSSLITFSNQVNDDDDEESDRKSKLKRLFKIKNLKKNEFILQSSKQAENMSLKSKILVLDLPD